MDCFCLFVIKIVYLYYGGEYFIIIVNFFKVLAGDYMIH